eukprot:2537076-Lingulodinium_polyedra.AAC.1
MQPRFLTIQANTFLMPVYNKPSTPRLGRADQLICHEARPTKLTQEPDNSNSRVTAPRMEDGC